MELPTRLIVNRNYRLEWLQQDLIEVEIIGAIDYSVAEEMVVERKRIANGQDVRMIVFVSDIKSIDKTAMKYLAENKEAGEGLIAAAFVISNSIIGSNIVNLFLKLKKDQRPAQIFGNRQEACLWLDRYSTNMTGE